MCLTGGTTVDPARVRDDIDELATASDQVRQYVNKYLAHIDQKPKAPIPAVTEVDGAVQPLGDMIRKYTLLLRGIDLQVESVLGFNWWHIFDEARVQGASRPAGQP